jgi:hypothetical protein
MLGWRITPDGHYGIDQSANGYTRSLCSNGQEFDPSRDRAPLAPNRSGLGLRFHVNRHLDCHIETVSPPICGFSAMRC